MPVHAEARRRLPRQRHAMAIAAGAVLAIGVVMAVSTIGPGPRFGGEVAGIVGTPESTAGESPGIGGAPSAASASPEAAQPSRSPGGAGNGAPGGDIAGEPIGGGTDAGGSGPTPAPTRTAGSAPTPTAPPRPVPTPSPTPAPGCVRIAPQLVGAHRNDATRIWADAGFTGQVVAQPGHGNYVIASQSPAAGTEASCEAGVTIGPAGD